MKPHPSEVPACPGACSHAHPVEALPDAGLAFLPRRSFVKTIALMSAGSFFAGESIESLFVAEVRAQSSSQVGVFRINLDSFPVLKNELGSLRMKVTGMPSTFREIIVTRQNGAYHAVSSRCTHQNNPVNAYNSSAGGLLCPFHFSLFNPDGSVSRGPATSPLDKYATSFDGQSTVSVEVAGLGFDISTAAVLDPASGATRLRIEFPTVRTVRYAVRFRPSLISGRWSQVPFSETLEGPASTNELAGDNTRRAVFVDRAEVLGFYAVTRTS